MNNNQGLSRFYTVVCSAMLGAICTGAYAGDAVNHELNDTSTDSRYTPARYEVLQMLTSKCRRYGVVWSGGVASRFSDRISPRPIRSRWDREAENRIRCPEVDAFNQRRVSDQPMTR